MVWLRGEPILSLFSAVPAHLSTYQFSLRPMIYFESRNTRAARQGSPFLCPFPAPQDLEDYRTMASRTRRFLFSLLLFFVVFSEP